MKPVARIKSAHGIKGDLYLMLLPHIEVEVEISDEITLKSEKGEEVTIQVDQLTPHKEGYIINSKDVKDRTQAESYKGWLYYAEEDGMSHLLGCEVVDGGRRIGKVVELDFRGMQRRLVLDNGVMVPFVEEFIEGYNEETQRIEMSLPEGLVEAQLEDS